MSDFPDFFKHGYAIVQELGHKPSVNEFAATQTKSARQTQTWFDGNQCRLVLFV
ncbi:MAG: hypothetical protein HC856_10070 [Pseudanabaena sp. RU_4_16]|nr:hypothetical protein [Pseudanabaena sp. RU_4_16]